MDDILACCNVIVILWVMGVVVQKEKACVVVVMTRSDMHMSSTCIVAITQNGG